MDKPNVAELKKRFNKMNILPYPKPRSSSIDSQLSSSSSEPSLSEKLKTETSNPSFDNAHQTSSNPPKASTQTSDATAALRNTILTRIRQQGVDGAPFKKAPVPLPGPPIQHRKERTSSETSSVSQETTLHQVTPPHVNTVTASNQVPVVSLTITDPDENTYAEVSNEVLGPSLYLNVPEMRTSHEPFERPDMSLSNSVATDLRKSFHYDSESLSTPLDAMLPLKCMFYEFETMINEYQRRDPHTIIYPKLKPTMPKITSNELSILQRYSNT